VFVYIEGPLIVMTYGPPTAQQAADAQERANNEAASGFPVDLNATGNQAASPPQPTVDGTPPGMVSRANHARQPSPAGFDPSFGKSSTEIAGEAAKGTADGIKSLATDAARIDVLHIPSGLGHLLGSAWRGGGGLGGLAALFWEPARAHVDESVAQAAEGDFRGAAASTVKAVSVGVAAGVAIGELGAAAVDAAGAGGSRRPSSAQRERVFEKGKDAGGTPRCVYCKKEITPEPGRPDSYEADHQQPFSRGGPTTDENLAPACRTCNRSKGAKTPEEFLGK
jgi:hypothetical protein